MSNDDGIRSRPGQNGEAGKPGASGPTPTDLAPGKLSLVDQMFGSPVRPGVLVQRLGAPPSLVVQTFGILAPMAGPVQQRPAEGADTPAAPNEAGATGDGGGRRRDDSPVQARTGSDGRPGAVIEEGVHAAAPGIARPSSRLPPGFTILDLFGRRHDSPVQARTAPEGASGAASEAGVHAAAAQGTATPSSRLPHGDTIQRLFGRHDISSVQAHTGAEAAASARAMGADAYATGNHIVLGSRADLHTAAHEAAHIVQQRGGVQLKGGVGAAGDAYEQHADAVADRVVAGRSAEDLLDTGATGGATSVVQRKEAADDAAILDNQAHLKNTDVEIPALEGALLATRLDAVKRGLLSKASFDAGLALAQAMTQLQPAMAAKGTVDKDVQNKAAVAAQQLFAALQHETADDKNFKVQPSTSEAAVITEVNPYTDETRITTYFFAWIASQTTFSGFQQLPESIRQGKWDDAFRGYRGLVDGLDLWVADQLRKTGKGTKDEALGDAHVHRAQQLTGLEQIAGKHATRLPALFHPDPKTVESEKAAGRPVADTIPMNVYFWKDDKTGKVHLYDLTTGRPQEQTIEGPPTAAAMQTFFEEVARYPKGSVRYTLPDGASGVSHTSGDTKWYEWVGYAGLAAAAVGLAFVTAGASVAATWCFAAGALAGGLSAGGHLADTAHLGTATSATVVLDAAQIIASLASFGAMGLTLKAGSAAGALAGSRWFVPLLSTAGSADVVQLLAFSDITFKELDKIQKGPGSPEDRQRAAAVLLTQWIVTGGLTVLSVQGARNAHAFAGRPIEIVEQNGVKVARVLGESTPEPVPHAETSAADREERLLAPGRQTSDALHQAPGGHPDGRDASTTGPTIRSGVSEPPEPLLRDGQLSARQLDLDRQLAASTDKMIIIGKREVTATDLAALTKATGVEHATVILHDDTRALVRMESYAGGQLPSNTKRLLMHSHPSDWGSGMARFISEADIEAIISLKQEYSYMVTIDGTVYKFTTQTIPMSIGDVVRELHPYHGWVGKP